MILGVDVREHEVFAAAVDDSGSIVRRGEHEGPPTSAAARAVRAALTDDQPARIGIAVGDPHDARAGEIVAAIASSARASTSPRVVTRGSAVALGEHWRGSAKGARQVVSLVVSDTVHSGLVLDGVPFEGAHGLAGAAAWLAMNPVEREDYRRFGSLQAEIGAAGIVRRLVWRIKSGDQSRVLEMAGGDINAIQIRHVFEGSRAGDGVAVSVVRDTARYIGMAIASLVAVADPDVVVVSGLIADAADQLLLPSTMEAVRRLPKSIAGHLTVLPASLGEDAALLGAVRAAMVAP